jgi:hypothetical protein
MDQNLKDQICRAVALTLGKMRGRDPIDIADKIGDTVELLVDMNSQESGVASMPPDMAQDTWDVKANSPAEPRQRPTLDIPRSPQSVVPVRENGGSVQKRLITMPGDPGYSESKPADLPKQRIISAIDIQRRPITRPGSNVRSKQYWDEATLIETIQKNTPAEVQFEMAFPDGHKEMAPAIQNVINQQGMGNVLLTYRHPAVDARNDFLVAFVTLSLYEEAFDFGEIMDGPNGIMEQLKGKYKIRPEKMEPTVGPEPAQLSSRTLSSSPMSDGVEISVETGSDGRLVNPGGHVQVNPDGSYIRQSGEIYRRITEGQRDNNAALVPKGREVKPR